MQKRVSVKSTSMTLNLREIAILFGIVWVIILIVFPQFGRPRSHEGMSPTDSLRSLLQAIRMYTQDNDQYFPPKSSYWDDLLRPYVRSDDDFIDIFATLPDKSDVAPERRRSVALNANLYGLKTSDVRPMTVIFAPAHYRYRPARFGSKATYYVPYDLTEPDTGLNDEQMHWQTFGVAGARRQGGEAYYAFADGSVRFLAPHEVHSVMTPGHRDEPGFSPQ